MSVNIVNGASSEGILPLPKEGGKISKNVKGKNEFNESIFNSLESELKPDTVKPRDPNADVKSLEKDEFNCPPCPPETKGSESVEKAYKIDYSG